MADTKRFKLTLRTDYVAEFATLNNGQFFLWDNQLCHKLGRHHFRTFKGAEISAAEIKAPVATLDASSLRVTELKVVEEKGEDDAAGDS